MCFLLCLLDLFLFKQSCIVHGQKGDIAGAEKVSLFWYLLAQPSFYEAHASICKILFVVQSTYNTFMVYCSFTILPQAYSEAIAAGVKLDITFLRALMVAYAVSADIDGLRNVIERGRALELITPAEEASVQSLVYDTLTKIPGNDEKNWDNIMEHRLQFPGNKKLKKIHVFIKMAKRYNKIDVALDYFRNYLSSENPKLASSDYLQFRDELGQEGYDAFVSTLNTEQKAVLFNSLALVP